MTKNIASHLYSVPDPLAPKSEKDSDAYALEVVKYVFGATKEYREARDSKFQKNRLYAEGKQSVGILLDQLEINGKDSYTNIQFKPTQVSKKFERIVVDGYMINKDEYPRVTSISKHIIDAKRKKRIDAQFRMDNKDLIAQVSQEAGFPVEDPNAFVPESMEDLNIYYDLNDKEEEELLMQDTLSFLLNDIDIESIKRKALREFYQVSLIGLYNYIDNNGKLQVDVIDGEDCLYSNSMRDDFKDIHFAGRKLRMTVSSLRARFKIKDEKAFFNSIKKANNSAFMGDWRDSYVQSRVRPYDALMVNVNHVWFKCSSVKEITKGRDRYGRKVYDVTNFEGDSNKLGVKSKSEGRKMTTQVYPETAYEGYFLADNNYVLEWGEQKNILRGSKNFEVICPFIFHMPDNNGGMLTPSPVEMTIDEIVNLDLYKHKIKQAIAKSAPDGFIVDIDALDDLDLGTGGILQPLDIMKIYRQTGDLYYSSKGEDGENKTNIPIRPTSGALAETLNTYVMAYNFSLSNIRDILGINEIRDGSATSPRISARFAQGQTEASNTATHVLYRGYLKMITSLVEQIGIRVWDNLKYGSPDNRFVKFLGSYNEDLIKNKLNVVDSAYDFKYELTMSADEKMELENNITTCLQNQSITMADAIMLRRIADFSIAERTLAFLTEKRRKQAVQDAQENSRIQAEQSAQAGAQVEEVKQQTAQLMANLEMAKEEVRGKNEVVTKFMDIAKTIIEASVKNGTAVPQEYQPIIDLVYQNAGIKTEQSASNTELEIQQQEQAMMQQQDEEALVQAVENGEISEDEAMQMIEGVQ